MLQVKRRDTAYDSTQFGGHGAELSRPLHPQWLRKTYHKSKSI